MDDGSQPVRTQRRGDERRKRILDAAYELVAEGGLENITMTNVSKRSAVPISSLYQYFAARQDIAMALASREISDARETPASIGQIRAASLSEYKASVLSQLRYIVDRMRADRGYRYLLAGLDASPQFLEVYRQNAPGNYRFVADGLLPHAPNLSRAEIKSITVLVLSTVVALGAKASQFKDEGEADAFVEDGLRMIWGYIISRISEV